MHSIPYFGEKWIDGVRDAGKMPAVHRRGNDRVQRQMVGIGSTVLGRLK